MIFGKDRSLWALDWCEIPARAANNQLRTPSFVSPPPEPVPNIVRPLVGAMCAKSLYLVGTADVGRRHVSDRRHGGPSWTSSHRHHEETGEFRSIQVFDFVKHAPDHDTVLKRYETSLDAMATTRRLYTR